MGWFSRKKKKAKKLLKAAAKGGKKWGRRLVKRNPYVEAAEFVYRGPKGYWKAKKKQAKWVKDHAQNTYNWATGKSSSPKRSAKRYRRPPPFYYYRGKRIYRRPRRQSSRYRRN